jgi:glyoxylase-like metal-dependent hydrolase (beta-lactamase superfamily II)/rhodanese-related sulfurtransferase
MIFQQIVNEEAGCLSYLIGCSQAGEAAVVDPARDRVDEYLAIARRKGLTVTRIIDTHLHADHISGNQALADKTGARILMHPAADAAFPTTPIEDEEEIRIGNVAFRVLHTPGHTPESVALLVTDRSRGEEPWFVLTGDTLFVGDVGRPDFGGERAAATLYQSLTRRLLTLPDSVEVYPAHGAGSACGRAMSSKTSTTIGFERRFNLALSAGDEAAFVKALMTGLPAKPPNFDRIIARNRARALPLSGEPRALSAAQVRELVAKGAVVVDTRTAAEFGEGHVPGALNVWIDSPQFANRVGLFAPADRPLVLVAGGPTDLTRAVQGLDASASTRSRAICSGAWGTGRARAPAGPGAADQRPRSRDHEGGAGGSAHHRRSRAFRVGRGAYRGRPPPPHGEAVRRLAELPTGRPTAVVCAGGLRSSLVISALAREGVPARWHNVAGGMGMWTRAGYPTARTGVSRAAHE